MINVFKMKKMAAFLMSSMLTCIMFFIGLQFYGFIWGMVLMFVGAILTFFLGSALIKNPFSSMLEGKGLLVMNLDSTGIIRFSLVGLQAPYIKGKVGKNKINDVWDRSTVVQIEAPKTNSIMAKKIKEGEKAGGIKIELDEKEYNDSRFALFHYPCLIWNDQIKSLITKDFISSNEKETFAEHGVLYLNRKMEELTSAIRDFGRYVVELTRPKKNFWGSSWMWIVAVGLGILLLLMFAPAVISAVQTFMANSGSGLTSAANAPVISPR